MLLLYPFERDEGIVKLKLSAKRRAIHQLMVVALLCSLQSFVTTPANAVADGTVACSGGGTFTITGTVVSGSSVDCIGAIDISEHNNAMTIN